MSARLALVCGAGGVLGAAQCRELASAGYRVLALRRPGFEPAPGDAYRACGAPLDDPAALREFLDTTLAHEIATVDVLVHNAARLVIAPFEQLMLEDLAACWHASVASAFVCAQAVIAGMRRRGRGTMVFTGATAARRGAANFAAFASAKFALRGLAQALAREFHPQGVHVVHLLLDGLLQGSASAAAFAPAAAADDDGRLLDPSAVASACRGLIEQPRSAWTHELELRPARERF